MARQWDGVTYVKGNSMGRRRPCERLIAERFDCQLQRAPHVQARILANTSIGDPLQFFDRQGPRHLTCGAFARCQWQGAAP